VKDGNKWKNSYLTVTNKQDLTYAHVQTRNSMFKDIHVILFTYLYTRVSTL